MDFPSNSLRRASQAVAVAATLAASVLVLADAAPPPTTQPGATVTLTATPISLPGAEGGVDLDYIACDRATGRVWIPAGGTGSVDVIAPRTFAVTHIDGFPTRERAIQGRRFKLGPTSIALAGAVVYAGNRGDGSICAIDAKTLRRGACFPLAASPDDLATSADGLVYVAATKELWVTQGAPPLGILPPEQSIVVLDASQSGSLARKTKIALEGAAEGYTVDERHGVFYTNLADKDRTVAIDVRSHRVTATWQPQCGGDGPRSIAVDGERRLVFVACTDRVVVLDAAHDGARLSSLPAGSGVDNIDYLEARRELFVASGGTGMLTVARVDQGGALAVIATAQTAPGARVVVVDAQGRAFVIDPRGGRILTLPPLRAD